MNYKKIGQQLLKENYVDDRMIFCHSHKNYTTSKNKWLYLKPITIGNEKRMPYFMLLSIKDDILNISYTRMSGGFKKHYAIIKLSNLIFKGKEVIDKVVDVYTFNVINDKQIRKDDFYIIAIHRKEEVNNLVEKIIEYRKNMICY